MDGAPTNPWVRADLGRYNPETLEIIEPPYREDYTRLMKERQQRLATVAIALEILTDAQGRLAETEEECRQFFHWLQHKDEL